VARQNHIPDDPLRREVVRLAREPGCIVCHAERDAVDRFFAWYLVEQYHEPAIIQRMQAAQGFCPQHTRQFVQRASPHVVSAVYRHLLADAVALLQRAEQNASATEAREALSTRLRPRAICLACEHAATAAERMTHALQTQAGDAEVRACVARPGAICQVHFLRLLSGPEWETARTLAHAQREAVGADLAGGGAAAEHVNLLVGSDPREVATVARRLDTAAGGSVDDFVVSPTSQPTAAQTQTAPGGTIPASERSPWSPAITYLEGLLDATNCPLCGQEEVVADAYLRWLSQELMAAATTGATGQATQAADDTLWLCRDHLWRFARTGEKSAVTRLLDRAIAHWADVLQALAAGLDQRPPRTFLARWWRGTGDARHAKPGGRRLNGWQALHVGFQQGRLSLEQRLANLRDSLLRPHPCPVCRFQHERIERVADLLDRALDDPGTAQRYQRAAGVCFRHLPLALAASSGPATAGLLLRAERTRIAVIHWELEEYWRARDWAHRWESKGDEQTAWRRAVGQYTGITPRGISR
jgi:hypothetical protein